MKHPSKTHKRFIALTVGILMLVGFVAPVGLISPQTAHAAGTLLPDAAVFNNWVQDPATVVGTPGVSAVETLDGVKWRHLK